ncbi:DddA-like double-stranded DNA deaminase toxin [Amycolatopsis sp. lyj-84]|uniref:DddA-like double-stranded DNA deaminase toxin n=1 Tax=Amycolatopsis sp. lyj-84 TaxID=2789284 RepID=UPI00397D125D
MIRDTGRQGCDLSEIEEVAAALRAAVTSLEKAEQATQRAAGGFGESAEHLEPAVYGTANPEIGALPGLYDELRQSAEQAVSHFRTVKATISAYLGKIGASATPANSEVTGPKWEDGARGRPGVHTTTTPTKSDPISQDRVDDLKRDLPPRVDRREGQKTHGQWVTDSGEGDVGHIVSGRDDLEAAAVQFFKDQGARRIPSTTADVEVKLAVHMQNKGIISATVAVNNEVCKGPFGCETLVPKILPQGSALTVYGTTPDGTPIGTTYLGQRKKP